MKWIFLSLLVGLGLVEFSIRIVLTVILCVSIVGLIVILEDNADTLLTPFLWEMAMEFK